MNELEYQQIQCPYCGEDIEVVIDCSIEEQDYLKTVKFVVDPSILILI